MQTREKMILCAACYVIAVALWFMVAQPAFTEAQTKLEELNGKIKEERDLKIKLNDMPRLQQERTNLQNEIDQLRGSVPKSPDIDILVLDLEKMALDSGLDLVSVEEPDKDKLRATEAAEQELQTPPPPKVSGVASAAGAASGAQGQSVAPKPPDQKPGPGGKKAEVSPEVETGLVKQYLLVSAQGSYAGSIELLRKLEAYQRVIGVTQIDVGYSSEGKEQKNPDPKQLKLSFLMTAYYLP